MGGGEVPSRSGSAIVALLSLVLLFSGPVVAQPMGSIEVVEQLEANFPLKLINEFEPAVPGSVRVCGDLLIVIDSDFLRERTYIYAYDLEGRLMWSRAFYFYTRKIRCRPGGDLLYIAATRHIIALDLRDGATAWDTELSPPGNVYAFAASDSYVAAFVNEEPVILAIFSSVTGDRVSQVDVAGGTSVKLVSDQEGWVYGTDSANVLRAISPDGEFFDVLDIDDAINSSVTVLKIAATDTGFLSKVIAVLAKDSYSNFYLVLISQAGTSEHPSFYLKAVSDLGAGPVYPGYLSIYPARPYELVLGDNLAFVRVYEELFAVDLSDGRRLWTQGVYPSYWGQVYYLETFGPYMAPSSYVVFSGQIYWNGTLLNGTVGLSPASGEPLWYLPEHAFYYDSESQLLLTSEGEPIKIYGPEGLKERAYSFIWSLLAGITLTLNPFFWGWVALVIVILDIWIRMRRRAVS